MLLLYKCITGNITIIIGITYGIYNWARRAPFFPHHGAVRLRGFSYPDIQDEILRGEFLRGPFLRPCDISPLVN